MLQAAILVLSRYAIAATGSERNFAQLRSDSELLLLTSSDGTAYSQTQMEC